MAASIQFHPLEVPRYLTEIHIVLPLHIHVIIYGDANVDAPTLCICNEADVPGGLLPSETLFSVPWSSGMIQPTERYLDDALVYTAFLSAFSSFSD